MNNKTMLCTALFTTVLLAACSSGKTDGDDFLKAAARDGMAEVRMAELALQRTSHAEVGDFARTMIGDHTRVNEAVRDLAERKNVELPAEASDEQREAYERLAALSGMAFDEAYMERNVRDHERAVELFRTQSQEGSDAEVRAFAARTLPDLEMHLNMARDLESRVMEGMMNSTGPEDTLMLHPDSTMPGPMPSMGDGL